MCELIARVEADPDFLPRTHNFGLEYQSFSGLCPHCPPDFLRVTFTCVSINPDSRPTADHLVETLETMLDKMSRDQFNNMKMSSDKYICDQTTKKTPSDRARLHSKISINNISNSNSSAWNIGEEMCRLDPDYEPGSSPQNPFTQLPQLREGRKMIGSSAELFSSCVEIPSSHNYYEWFRRKSLPYHCKQYSPPLIHSQELDEEDDHNEEDKPHTLVETETIPTIQHRVNKLFSKSRDDSTLVNTDRAGGLRRWGSCESGFFSASTDDPGLMSNRSIGSSLLTVSDLEVCIYFTGFCIINKAHCLQRNCS